MKKTTKSLLGKSSTKLRQDGERDFLKPSSLKAALLRVLEGAKVWVLFVGMVSAVAMPMSTAQETQSPTFAISVAPKEHAKLSLFLGVVGAMTPALRDMVAIIKKDLEFSGQFAVAVHEIKALHTKNEITKLFEQGYSLAVFLNDTPAHDGVEWRVYDTTQVVMLKGSKYTKRGTVPRGWAHNVSDVLWSVLTGDEGFFSTKLAYCKDMHRPKKRMVKYIYVADYDGSHEQELVTLPTVSVAPRWNNDVKSPLLFYSEYTNANVRLVGVSMNKKRKIASNFDGINMLPAFSKDGKHVVYCASHGDGTCQLYYHDKGAFRKITKNNGNNVSPTFSADGKKIFFCSDFQTGKPQVYCYNIETDNLDRLTHGGYCAAPSYCSRHCKLVYSKIVGGTMQLFLYDTKHQEHTQLTFDSGNKEECSWSPCGNFLLFSVEQGEKSRIAMLNIVTNVRRYITSEKQVCSYPAWSPTYEEFPIVA
ncbi:MAG: hypothetical protein NTX86_04385 [Candidatus Dependentiae bacterium]|nr:hypothetical protein [Candidatus Dependentiae bacterium]